MFVRLINQAERRMLIYKPYVHLDQRVLEAVKRAARRGVETRLFTNSWESNRLPDSQHIIVAYSYYPELYEAGVHIHEQPYRTQHGKALLIDDKFLAIGSHDMTPRATSTNIEDMLITDDRDAIARFASFYDEDMRDIPEVTPQAFESRADSLWDRFRLRLGRWARPLF
jgi:cardiolipin synthase